MQPSFAQQSYTPQFNVPQQKSQVVTLIDTIAHRNFAEASQLMSQHGYTPAQSIKQLTAQLTHFILQNGDEAIRQLSFVHPDKEMILDHQAKASVNKGFSNFSGEGNFAGQPSYTYNNCTGCGGTCGAKHNNVDGSNNASALNMSSHNTLNVLAVLAVFGVIALAVMRNK